MSPLLHSFPILAQAAAPAPQPGFNLSMLTMPLLLVGVYFLMIAPQRRKQKQHDKMLSELKSGDEVVTTGGIFGTITNVHDDRFVIRISDSTKVEVGKGFIQSVVKRSGTEEKN